MKREMICMIGSIICFLYCIVVYSIKSGSKFYLVWAAGGAFFLLLVPFFHFQIWEKLPSFLQKIIGIGLVTGILCFLVTEILIVSGFSKKGEDNLDYIIVLGAQVKTQGPSVALQYRLDTAYEYLIKNENTVCIVSGGKGANEPYSEAQGMYEYLIGRGIEKERLIKEDKSRNTYENILYSAQFLDKEKDSVGIVTNNFHVFRGTQLAKHQGFSKVSGIAAPSDIGFLPNNMAREFFGMMKDLVCGNLL